jgi:transcriptional regulator with XRE-family HTH domain
MLDSPAVRPERQQPETQHMLDVLKTAMRVLGVTVRELEKRVGLSSSYLSRLLAGKLPLRFDHVIQITHALGLEPAHLFHEAFPFRRPGRPGEAEATVEGAIRALSGEPAASPAPVAMKPEKVEELMEKTLRRLFRQMSEPG